ncbi:MAG: hypothetical protein A2010_17085 [Nitrospirae bacterium GWD2_57_9]|nr:MAG: hypothetical protein A2010_17085 [Nitrospirae bacterium GWD2_57_9]
MKRILVGAAAAMVLLSTVAWAQQGPGSGPGRGGRGRGMMYDPSRIETVSGKVTEVKEFTSMNGLNKGIHLTLDSGGKSMIVHLGPQSYLDQQTVKIAAGDNIEISGVKAARRGEEVFIAGAVKKDGQELKLRDETGRPLWAGKGRGAVAQPRKAPMGC